MAGARVGSAARLVGSPVGRFGAWSLGFEVQRTETLGRWPVGRFGAVGCGVRWREHVVTVRRFACWTVAVSGVRAGIEFVRMMVRGMMVCGLGFGVSGLGLGVWSLEFGVWGVGFKVEGVGCVSGDATPCKDTLVILHGVVSPECGAFSRAASTSFRSSTLISQKFFIKSFCRCKFSHKIVNLSFILAYIKNELTYSCGY